MAATRKVPIIIPRDKTSKIGWILAGALAVGAASALAAATHPHAPAGPPGANATDLTGPAAASGWG